MRGRTPKPAALKEAQGNPGRRPIVDAPAAQDDAGQQVAQVKNPSRKSPVAKLVKVKADAKRVYDLIAPQLRRINFLRDTDEPAFWRYCDTMARYWRVTKTLDDLGGETYECDTTNGGKMQRLRPEFMVQERLAKRLDSLEDRFGLSPMARQQYILALSRQPQMLPGFSDPPSRGQGQENPKAPDAAAAAPVSKPAAIGGLRGDQVH